MIFLVITSLLQVVLAVAGVGECNVSYIFPQNKAGITCVLIIFDLLYSKENASDLSVFSFVPFLN